ncbi:SRPBCC family protein [Staphylococcus durrellii]|uniref:SRPBCC family protein n=1 Tax=Staphylococcus durrellii TaxID=2781773 RepID=UPI00189DFE68|nr:SRPBCC domain-containing protein [Staphylococcus durrellii]MBF7016392.1 SRPBCC domain-containing protein [Staphylococcus durrellii]
MAKYNVENDNVNVRLERLFKSSPELLYRAWTDESILKRWFMTSERTNQLINIDAQEQGSYEIIDIRKGKENKVQGQFESLIENAYIEMTISMPEISETEDKITIEIFEREAGITQMIFTYNAVVPKERRLSNLEYKQQKKEYHDSTAHGFETMFDKLQQVVADERENGSN